MIKKENNIINARNIAIVLLSLICLVISLYLYGRNKSKVFKDEYMKNIFVEEKESNNLKEENTISKEESIDEDNSSKINSKKVNKIIVEIKGEVNKPNVYEVEEGAVIKDIIEIAGGLTNKANIDKINRAEKLRANELIVIPNKDNNEDSNIQINNILPEDKYEIININTASIDELQKINGIGEVKAKNIIEYREKNGVFKSIDEIKNIDGIGEKTFEKIKDKIQV